MKHKKAEIDVVNNMPTVAQLEAELKREVYRKRYNKALMSTIYALIIVAAISVLIATLYLPVLRIYGTSMTPTVSDGDITVSIKSKNFSRGDIVAFWLNNKILVKRVIAKSGEWVDIDEDGNVFINGVQLEEDYIAEKDKGECDIKLPYQVPEGRIFVMGDHRATSADSRSSEIGCVLEEQIVGKLIAKVWPISDAKTLK